MAGQTYAFRIIAGSGVPDPYGILAQNPGIYTGGAAYTIDPGAGITALGSDMVFTTYVIPDLQIPTVCSSTASYTGNSVLTTQWDSITLPSGSPKILSFATNTGNVYAFSSCGTSADTKIRIYNRSGQVIASNDDDGPFCSGSAASIAWKSTFTDTAFVLLTQFDCADLTQSVTISLRKYDVQQAPSIDSILPGAALVGSQVSLKGKGFSNASALLLANTSVNFSVLNDSLIQFTVPSAQKTALVSVQTFWGTAVSNDSIYILPCIPPTKPLINPSSGSVPNISICSGDQLNLSISNTSNSIQWFNNGIEINGQNGTQLTVLNSGNYQVKVTDIISGCFSISDTLFVKTLTPVSPSVQLSVTKDTLCAGQNVQFKARSLFGGSSPIFTFYKNNIQIQSGIDSSLDISNVNHGDIIRCSLQATNTCQTTNLVFSNSIPMTVLPVLTPSITIVSSADTGIFQENFEDFSTLTSKGWVFTNNSNPLGIKGFAQGDSLLFPAYNGTANSYLNAGYLSGSGNSQISNWAITPIMRVENGNTLRFYTRKPAGSVFADRLEVRMAPNAGTNVGNSATSVGDFTDSLRTINPSQTLFDYPSTWTLYEIPISGLQQPANVRFAFRYVVDNGGPAGTNSDNIGIDAVSLIKSSICQGQAIAFNAIVTGDNNISQFNWYYNGQLSANNGANFSPSTQAANGDSVSVTAVSKALCAANAGALRSDRTLAVFAVPAKPTIQSNAGTRLCAGDSITLTSTPNLFWVKTVPYFPLPLLIA
jgi:hypothetical protein